MHEQPIERDWVFNLRDRQKQVSFYKTKALNTLRQKNTERQLINQAQGISQALNSSQLLVENSQKLKLDDPTFHILAHHQKPNRSGAQPKNLDGIYAAMQKNNSKYVLHSTNPLHLSEEQQHVHKLILNSSQFSPTKLLQRKESAQKQKDESPQSNHNKFLLYLKRIPKLKKGPAQDRSVQQQRTPLYEREIVEESPQSPLNTLPDNPSVRDSLKKHIRRVLHSQDTRPVQQQKKTTYSKDQNTSSIIYNSKNENADVYHYVFNTDT